jgi:hypothetical protein
LFLKAKYKADGMFERLRGRLVSGGHKQKREEFKDLYSPTAATNSVMMRAAIAHSKGEAVATADVPSAFVRVPYPKDGSIPLTHMKLDKFLSEVFIQLKPEWASLVDEDGRLTVELDKALY